MTASGIPAKLLAALSDAQHVCVLTGAGASAESGVPTFRDAQQGLWAKHDPYQLATPDGFLSDPALVWRWYRWRRELVAKAAPNAGHVALVRLAERVPKLTLITQNVDGLHQRAGSRDVIEFHGNLFVDRCFDEGVAVDIDSDQNVPTCPGCGAYVRPGVVWFGENIPSAALDASFAAVADCDVFLSVGTSSLVYPAAGLVDIAREAGALTVEVNPEASDAAACFDVRLEGPSGEFLPKLIDSLSS